MDQHLFWYMYKDYVILKELKSPSMLITKACFACTVVTKMVTSVCGYEVKQQNAITNVTCMEQTEEFHSSVCNPS
jgi:hypothetical protein